MLKSLLVSVATLAVLVVAPSVSAQGVNDFVFKNFEADYYLSNQDPQGTMRVVESMTVDFSGQNRGIERAIPTKYSGRSVEVSVGQISSESGAPTQYTTRTENDNLIVRIGDPDKRITGLQQYKIEYTLNNVVKFYENHDEIYWDINGDQWQQRFEVVVARFHLPEELAHDGQLDCYTGSFGSNIDQCVTSADGGVVFAATTAPLGAEETLTVIFGVEKGYFRQATLLEKISENIKHILGVLLPPLLIGGYAIRHWWRNGRDPKGRGTIVVEYSPPNGLSAAEVGAIADFRVDSRETTSIIIDLAIRGYIKIIEEKKIKRFRRDTLEYSIELTNADTSKLKEFETIILKGLFGALEQGKVVTFDSLKNKFYTSVLKSHTKLMDGLTKAGYFKHNPKSAGLKLLIISMIVIFVGIFLVALLGPAFFIGILLAATIVFVCISAMPARTEAGVAVKEHAEGLKMYIETAEADRIKMMQSPDAPYSNSAEPKKTVELYEKLLPFAIVFGVEKQWSEEFKDIYTQPPEWFAGSNATTFNSVYLASALNTSMATAMTTAYSSPSSSGSSGFSGGGGFAGGGGGGGGGGGW